MHLIVLFASHASILEDIEFVVDQNKENWFEITLEVFLVGGSRVVDLVEPHRNSKPIQNRLLLKDTIGLGLFHKRKESICLSYLWDLDLLFYIWSWVGQGDILVFDGVSWLL